MKKETQEYEEYKPYEPYDSTIPSGLTPLPKEQKAEIETPREIRWGKVISVPLLFLSVTPLTYLLFTYVEWDKAHDIAIKAGTEIEAYTASPSMHPLMVLIILLLSVLTLGILLFNSDIDDWTVQYYDEDEETADDPDEEADDDQNI